MRSAEKIGPNGHQVVPLLSLDGALLKQVGREIARTTIHWTTNYAEYQSNGWLTASLLNNSQKTEDTTIADGEGRSTQLLDLLPCTSELLSSLGLDIFWARIARLEPNSYLWEHVDYTEFGQDRRLRLHIPLETNSHAEIIFNNFAVHMNLGILWALDPKGVHGAVNRGHTPRLHIIIDCRLNEHLTGLLRRAIGPIQQIRQLPQAPQNLVLRRLQEAAYLIRSGYKREGERLILTLFHDYFLPPGWTLEQVSALYSQLKMKEDSYVWERRRLVFLGGIQN